MPDANAFTEDADVIDETQDVAQPVRTIAPPPPVVPVAAPAIAAPGARTVAAPIGYPGNAAAIGADTQFRSMINRGTPISQAQQAVDSAFRFQAQRGYQNDLQAGMAPAAALAKWAPMLFSGPKGGNLGEAASFIRATTPTVPKPVNVGGTLYNIEPGGRSVTVTPGQRTVAKPPAGLAADLADARKTLDSYVKDIEKAEASDDVTLKAQLPRLRQRRTDLENYVQMKELQQSPRQILATPGAAPVPAVPAPSAAVASSAPQTITTQEQYDALAPGAVYTGKNGRRYRKPERTAPAAVHAPASTPVPPAAKTDTGIDPKLWRRAMSSTGGNTSAARRWVRAYYREHPEDAPVNPESEM